MSLGISIAVENGRTVVIARRQPAGDGSLQPASNPSRVITARMPKSLHERLRDAAYHSKTSINQLAVAAIERVVADVELAVAAAKPAEPAGEGGPAGQ